MWFAVEFGWPPAVVDELTVQEFDGFCAYFQQVERERKKEASRRG